MAFRMAVYPAVYFYMKNQNHLFELSFILTAKPSQV
jgi:hypothetical protein